MGVDALMSDLERPPLLRYYIYSECKIGGPSDERPRFSKRGRSDERPPFLRYYIYNEMQKWGLTL